MTSPIKKLTDLARSPQVTTAVKRARQEATSPANKARLDGLRARVTHRP